MMRRVLPIFILFLLGALFTATAAFAQEEDVPPADAWRATYWNNPSVAGFWILQQLEDADLDYDWGDESPDERINSDYWSARWERTIRVQPGNYLFTATVDNGIRLWVDDALIIDEWSTAWAAGGTYTGDIFLDDTPHQVRVEYFDAEGPAAIRVSWEVYVGPPEAVQDWLTEYYNNTTLSGDPVAFRDEPDIALNLRYESPIPGTVTPDNFSVRWLRDLDLAAGVFEFSMRVDDGGRLYVKGSRVIDAWQDQGPTTYTTTVEHEGGPLAVVMEFYERRGYAVAELTWERVDDLVPAQPSPATPTPSPAASTATGENPPSLRAVIVDDGDPGFIQGGPLQRFQQQESGYGGDSLRAPNHQTSNSDYVWARWFPNLQSGTYEVFVFIPEASNATRQARYWLAHAGQYSLSVVDQAANAGTWVSLGTYEFRGAEGENLSLADVTREASESTQLLWDAARWEPIE